MFAPIGILCALSASAAALEGVVTPDGSVRLDVRHLQKDDVLTMLENKLAGKLEAQEEKLEVKLEDRMARSLSSAELFRLAELKLRQEVQEDEKKKATGAAQVFHYRREPLEGDSTDDQDDGEIAQMTKTDDGEIAQDDGETVGACSTNKGNCHLCRQARCGDVDSMDKAEEKCQNDKEGNTYPGTYVCHATDGARRCKWSKTNNACVISDKAAHGNCPCPTPSR